MGLISKDCLELMSKIMNCENGSSVILDNKTYEIYADKCIYATGFNASNTALISENPKGERFSAICLMNKRNVTVDGNGALIRIHGVMTPFLVYNCDNLTIRNIKVDYARPTMSEFTIKDKLFEGVYIIEINKDSLYYIENNLIMWRGEERENGTFYWEYPCLGKNVISAYYDPKTEETRNYERASDFPFPNIPEFASIVKNNDDTLTVTLKNKDAFFPVGCVVQTREVFRKQLGGLFERCSNISIENLRIYSMSGFGLLWQFCNNIVVNNVDCTPKSGRTICSDADVFHFSGCKGSLVIKNSKASGSHDDCVNIHGTHLRVEGKSEDGKIIKVKFMNPYSWGFRAFDVGDEVEWVNKDNLKTYGKGVITNVIAVNEKEICISFDVPAAVKIGDFVENSTCMPEVVIENCVFGATKGRAILCLTNKKVLIQNNKFYKVCGNVLCLEDDCNFWYESGYTTDVELIGNIIDGCCYGDKSSVPVIYVNPIVIAENGDYVHKSVKAKLNVFENPPKDEYFVVLNYLENFEFANNNIKSIIKRSVAE